MEGSNLFRGLIGVDDQWSRWGEGGQPERERRGHAPWSRRPASADKEPADPWGVPGASPCSTDSMACIRGPGEGPGPGIRFADFTGGFRDQAPPGAIQVSIALFKFLLNGEGHF